MKQETERAIIDGFLERFHLPEPNDVRPAEAILATVSRFPEPDKWVQLPDDGGNPRALLLTKSDLIEIGAAMTDSGVRFSSEIRPLKDAGVVIRLDSFGSSPAAPGHYMTEWTFKFQGDHKVTVSGHVSPPLTPVIDELEEFARAVATTFGMVQVPNA